MGRLLSPILAKIKYNIALHNKTFLYLELIFNFFLLSVLVFYIIIVFNINDFIKNREANLIQLIEKNLNASASIKSINFKPVSSILFKEVIINNEQYSLLIPEIEIRINILKFIFTFDIVKSVSFINLNDPFITVYNSGNSLRDVRLDLPLKQLKAFLAISRITVRNTMLNLNNLSLPVSYFELYSSAENNINSSFVFDKESRRQMLVFLNFDTNSSYFDGNIVCSRSDQIVGDFVLNGNLKKDQIKMIIEEKNLKIKTAFEYGGPQQTFRIGGYADKVELEDFYTLNGIFNVSLDKIFTKIQTQKDFSVLGGKSIFSLSFDYTRMSNNYKYSVRSRSVYKKEKMQLHISGNQNRNVIHQILLRTEKGSCSISALHNNKYNASSGNIICSNIIINNKAFNGSARIYSPADDQINIVSKNFKIDYSGFPFTLTYKKKPEGKSVAVVLPGNGVQVFSAISSSGAGKFQTIQLDLDNVNDEIFESFFNVSLLHKNTLSGRMELTRSTNTHINGDLYIKDVLLNKNITRLNFVFNNSLLEINNSYITVKTNKYICNSTVKIKNEKDNIYFSYYNADNRKISSKIYGSLEKKTDNYYNIYIPNNKLTGEISAALYLKPVPRIRMNIYRLPVGKKLFSDLRISAIASRPLKANGRVILHKINPLDVTSKCSFNFKLEDNKVITTNLIYQDSFNNYLGQGDLDLISSPRVFKYNLQLNSQDSDETLLIYGDNNGLQTKAHVIIKKLYLNKVNYYNNTYINGIMRANVLISGNLKNPNFNIKFFVKDYKLLSKRYKLYSEIIKHQNVLEIPELIMERETYKRRDKEINDALVIKNGIFENNVISLPVSLINFSTFALINSDIHIKYLVDSKLLSINSLFMEVNGKKLKNMSTAAKIRDKSVVFTKYSEHGIEGTIHSFEETLSKFNFKYYYDNKEILTITGEKNKEKFDLIAYTTKLQVNHLNIFSEVIEENIPEYENFEYIYNNSKYDANGFVHLVGNKDDYLLNGRFLVKGRAKILSLGKMTKSYIGDIQLKNNKIILNDVNLKFADSEAMAAGYISMNKELEIDQYSVDISTDEEHGIPIKLKTDDYEAEGNAVARVDISGNSTYPKISGTILSINSDITYTGEGETIDYYEPPFFNRVDWDLEITTDEKTSFYNPVIDVGIKKGSKLAILNRVYDNTLKCDGVIEGTKGNFTHLGIEFRVEEVKIIFSKDDYEIDPLVKARGVYKTRDENNETVEIYAIMNGRLSSGNIVFSSDPPYSADKIKTLLGFAPSREQPDYAGSDTERALATLKTYSIDVNILRPFERKIRRMTSLDYFKIESDFIDNIDKVFYDPDISSALTTRFFMGKYLTEDLFFQWNLEYLLKSQTNIANPFGHTIDIEYEFEEFDIEYEWKLDPADSSFGDHDIIIKRNWRF